VRQPLAYHQYWAAKDRERLLAQLQARDDRAVLHRRRLKLLRDAQLLLLQAEGAVRLGLESSRRQTINPNFISAAARYLLRVRPLSLATGDHRSRELARQHIDELTVLCSSLLVAVSLVTTNPKGNYAGL